MPATRVFGWSEELGASGMATISGLSAGLAARGGTHDISESCFCRKPKPGMLLYGAKEFGLNLAECWMVGDTSVDIEAGKKAGCKTALITSLGELTAVAERPDVLARTLMELTHQHLLSS
jgi:histidinol phosphatase-like enzyme